MARIGYDTETAAAFHASREVPRAGLEGWREALRRHLDPRPGMTVVDVGAGTGAFATALCDWFGVTVVAVEPAAAMRAHVPVRTDVQVVDGRAEALPVPDSGADAVWLSTVLHHVPDLGAAAREFRRVLRPGGRVLIRNAFPGRADRLGLVRWFPEIVRTLATFPTVERTRDAFTAAGFTMTALEPVRQTDPAGPAGLLARLDTLRTADTLMRDLTEAEFARGRERLRHAVDTGVGVEAMNTWLDLLVLRAAAD